MPATTYLSVGDYGPALLRPSAHTPGDFSIALSDGSLMVVAPDPKMPGCFGLVAMVLKSDFDDSQAYANARLFVGAPKLLAALRAIVLETMPNAPAKPSSVDSWLPEPLLQAAVEALAEAEGWK